MTDSRATAGVTPLDSSQAAAKPGHVSFVSATGALPLGRTSAPQKTPERRNICASLETVNHLLACDGSAEDAQRTLPMGNIALDSWRRVPMLREWRLDGVMLGVDTEENESQVLNVAVGGICRRVVNHFDTLTMFPLDVLYVGLIAVPTPAKAGRPARYEFNYCLFTSRCLTASASFPKGAQKILEEIGEGPFRASRLHLMVGAWKVGKVVDLKAVWDPNPQYHSEHTVKGERLTAEHALSVALSVEWEDWRSLHRKWFDNDVQDMRCLVGHWHYRRSIRRMNRDEALFNWPSEMPSDPTVRPMRPYNPEDLIGSDPTLTAEENLRDRKRLLTGISDTNEPVTAFNPNKPSVLALTEGDCVRAENVYTGNVPTEAQILAVVQLPAVVAMIGQTVDDDATEVFNNWKAYTNTMLAARRRAVVGPLRPHIDAILNRLRDAVSDFEDAIFEDGEAQAMRDWVQGVEQATDTATRAAAEAAIPPLPNPKRGDVFEVIEFLIYQPYDDPLFECDAQLYRLADALRRYMLVKELLYDFQYAVWDGSFAPPWNAPYNQAGRELWFTRGQIDPIVNQSRFDAVVPDSAIQDPRDPNLGITA